MFQVKFRNVEVQIEGCPEKGMGAIDFRRQHGLPDRPSNVEVISDCDVQSEELCREFAKWANDAGDIEVNGGGEHVYYGDRYGGRQVQESTLGHSRGWNGFKARHLVTPATVAAWLKCPASDAQPADVAKLLRELEEDRCGVAEKARRAKEAAEHAKAQAQAIAELSAMDAAALFADGTEAGADGMRRLALNHRHRDLLRREHGTGGYPALENLTDAAIPLARKVADLLAVHNAKVKEGIAAKEAMARSEMRAWIDAHGSPRLKRMADENIECTATYRSERLTLERPGWRWEASVNGTGTEPRNPPEEAFALLDEARKLEPEAELQFWTDPHEHDEDCYDDQCEKKYDWRGYACIAEFLGKEIVFGGPN